ncbi:flagellar biosynthetic protein (FlhB)-like protein [Magnetococcus marinus MC-1]|uniref:Flagellar biosynthetic protein (FlhB)-like protein n=1 Tax=Magnetococcus marinus (strain ATCC BAA-1437 / JCM 17883 / MC-1) TaxID=156889 RepID=A0LC32_MAGMM|nr:EscU/YscU/HrcU family type III secretion system export apparatus switch protein [Magnetococcus marinus]ABK45525.1 flagellar biosynthetic protein (FlhB)-like protein [Magnetococcus marinus MC-1]
MADSQDGNNSYMHKRAVALRYRLGKDTSPRVTASGRGRLAETILKRAKEGDVPLLEDPDLVHLLEKIPVGSEVPPQLYQAVAEVLAYIYRINGRMGGKGS